MRVTDEMVEAALQAWYGNEHHAQIKDDAVPDMRAALQAALAAAPQAEPVAWAQKAALDGVREYGEIIATLYGDGYQPEQEWTEPLYLAPPAPDALRKSVPWPEAVPWQGGLSNDELRREWDLRLPGVEPTDRELSAFAVGIEAGHKVVWVHDPDIERLREAARMAHKRVLIALDEPKQTMSDGKALREIVRQLRLMDAELREALGDEK